jgi:hypothetical protein
LRKIRLGTGKNNWGVKGRAIVLLAGLALARGSIRAQDQPAQQPAPQPPPQDQNASKNTKESASPPQDQEQKKKEDVATEAAEATKKLGEETLDKVRDWESGWLTGPYVGRNRALVALTTPQRQKIYLQQTFTTPSAYFKRMFVAGIDQLRDSPAQWGEGWGAYGDRFASREGQFIAANSLATLGNAALRYEPRYDQCRCSGFWLRTRHAILRNFVTYNHSEQDLRPQWALYAGAFGGGLISTAWKPHPHNVVVEGGFAMLGQAGYGALLNFFTEFAGDINRRLGAKRQGAKR